jgi:hypothetical protein
METIEQILVTYLLLVILVLGFAIQVNFKYIDKEIGYVYLFLISRAAFALFAERNESPDWLQPIIDNNDFRILVYFLSASVLVYKLVKLIRSKVNGH